MDNTPISREQFLAASDRYALEELYRNSDIIRAEAHQRGDLRNELFATNVCTDLLLIDILREAIHSLHAIYARLPWESGTSTDWTTPRDEARRNREARRTA